jgi:hypothetical protein
MAFTPNVPQQTRLRDLPPRARDLNRKLGDAIDEFRRYYPDTTDGDVRRALEAASEQQGGGPTPRRKTMALTAAGLLAAAIGTIVATDGTFPTVVPTMGWVAVAAAVAAILVAMRRSRRDS